MVNSIVVIVGILMVVLALFAMWVCWRCLEPPTSADDVKTATDMEDPRTRPTATTATSSADRAKRHTTNDRQLKEPDHERKQTATTATGSAGPGTRPTAPTATSSADRAKRHTTNDRQLKEPDHERKQTATTATGSAGPGRPAANATGPADNRRQTANAIGPADPRTKPAANASGSADGGRSQNTNATSPADPERRPAANATGPAEPRRRQSGKGPADPGISQSANATGPADPVRRPDANTTGPADAGRRPTNNATGPADTGRRPAAKAIDLADAGRTQNTDAASLADPGRRPGANATGLAEPGRRQSGKGPADPGRRPTNNATGLADLVRRPDANVTGPADAVGRQNSNNQHYMMVPDDVMKDTTIESFVQEMANKQPVRFTAEQLTGFTKGNCTQLGRGGFGKVYKGTLPNGLDVAVKVLDVGLDQKTWKKQFMAEIGSIGRTHHINLVRLYGFCSDGDTHALVYELMEHGSLDTYLSTRGADMTLANVAEIATGVAKGLKYLHEDCDPNILHLDIKPGNVLLDGSLTPKVADFGLARLVNLEDTHVTVSRLGGTFGYAPPEVVLEGDHRLTKKWDVYSFGILLLNMVGRGRRLVNQQWFPSMVWTSYEEGKLMELLGRRGEDDGCRELVERMCKVAFWCVQRQPPERLSMSKVVKMLEGDVVNISPPPNPFQYLVGPAPAPAAN